MTLILPWLPAVIQSRTLPAHSLRLEFTIADVSLITTPPFFSFLESNENRLLSSNCQKPGTIVGRYLTEASE